MKTPSKSKRALAALLIRAADTLRQRPTTQRSLRAAERHETDALAQLGGEGAELERLRAELEEVGR